MYLGMSQSEADVAGDNRGTREGGKLKETGFNHWDSPNEGATNSSGFTALPSGRVGGDFVSLGTSCFFWSSTMAEDEKSWYRGLGYTKKGINRHDWRHDGGFSVRCLKD